MSTKRILVTCSSCFSWSQKTELKNTYRAATTSTELLTVYGGAYSFLSGGLAFGDLITICDEDEACEVFIINDLGCDAFPKYSTIIEEGDRFSRIELDLMQLHDDQLDARELIMKRYPDKFDILDENLVIVDRNSLHPWNVPSVSNT